MEILLAVLLGAALDLLLGDPRGFPHPVVLMGRLIALLEQRNHARSFLKHRGRLRQPGLVELQLQARTAPMGLAQIGDQLVHLVRLRAAGRECAHPGEPTGG